MSPRKWELRISVHIVMHFCDDILDLAAKRLRATISSCTRIPLYGYHWCQPEARASLWSLLIALTAFMVQKYPGRCYKLEGNNTA